jgi:ABC-2 type transport system ATP-binding protein
LAVLVTTTPEGTDHVIAMSGVSRRFNGLWAVRDVSLAVPAGSILGLIGPSGSGKTTTVRMLTGTLRPTHGEARVLGEDPRQFSRQTRERIAYMPQLFSLYPDLTAEENVGFVAALYGISWFGRGKRIKRALSVVDLWEARNRRAGDLSGGMQRRLDLACAIVHDPQVLFIDEPTAGIDPMLRRTIWDELRAMRDEGQTLLVTTQYVAEAEYCDRVAILTEGKLIALDAPEELRRSVFGGDVLQVDADRPIDPQLVANVPEVIAVQQPEARRLIVTATQAGTAMPRLSEAFRAAGVGLISVDEYQPSFDEVFAALVRRERAEDREAEPSAAETSAAESPGRG